MLVPVFVNSIFPIFWVSHLIFGMLDLSSITGLLDVNEIRTLVARVYSLPISAKIWQCFEELLLNCSSLQPPLPQLGVGVGDEFKEVFDCVHYRN